MTAHVVILASAHGPYVYGPFVDQAEAGEFAAFLTREVDPARAVRLMSPVDELLGWWRNQRERETKPLAEEGTWPPKLGDVWQDRHRDRWLAVPSDELVNLVCGCHGSHQEVWRQSGPLTLVSRPEPREPEVPF